MSCLHLAAWRVNFSQKRSSYCKAAYQIHKCRRLSVIIRARCAIKYGMHFCRQIKFRALCATHGRKRSRDAAVNQEKEKENKGEKKRKWVMVQMYVHYIVAMRNPFELSIFFFFSIIMHHRRSYRQRSEHCTMSQNVRIDSLNCMGSARSTLFIQRSDARTNDLHHCQLFVQRCT